MHFGSEKYGQAPQQSARPPLAATARTDRPVGKGMQGGNPRIFRKEAEQVSLKRPIPRGKKLLALGVYPEVGLKEARKRCDEAGEQFAMSNDPGEVKKEIRAIARAAEKELQNTFEVAAREWFAACSPALTPRHAAKLQRYP